MQGVQLLADHAAILTLALLAEAVWGYPDWLYRAIGHPVTWIGRLIAALDDRWNAEKLSSARRRAAGVAALVTLMVCVGATAAALETALLPLGAAGGLLLAILAGSLLAQRSLFDHVRAVEIALRSSGLAAGRTAVSMIVGRDPLTLDEAGVCRAAIESLSENFSDGVVAPAFWLAAGGLPGCALYKAVNTADSMIGHRTPRHQAFGWAAARFDDLVNLPASRLTAALILLAAALDPGASARGAAVAVLSDARRHRSPNAGWPEAAMAGALGLRLAGPRSYDGAVVDDAWMGEGRAEAGPHDIARALSLYRSACVLLWLLAATIAFWLRRAI